LKYKLSYFNSWLLKICYYYIQNNTFNLCSLFLIWFSRESMGNVTHLTMRPKGGSSLRYSWLTMRPSFVIITADRKVAPASSTLGLPWDLYSWSLWLTERWLQLQVLLAHHKTSIRDHYTERCINIYRHTERCINISAPHREVYKHLNATPRGV